MAALAELGIVREWKIDGTRCEVRIGAALCRLPGIEDREQTRRVVVTRDPDPEDVRDALTQFDYRIAT